MNSYNSQQLTLVPILSDSLTTLEKKPLTLFRRNHHQTMNNGDDAPNIPLLDVIIDKSSSSDDDTPAKIKIKKCHRRGGNNCGSFGSGSDFTPLSVFRAKRCSSLLPTSDSKNKNQNKLRSFGRCRQLLKKKKVAFIIPSSFNNENDIPIPNNANLNASLRSINACHSCASGTTENSTKSTHTFHSFETQKLSNVTTPLKKKENKENEYYNKLNRRNGSNDSKNRESKMTSNNKVNKYEKVKRSREETQSQQQQQQHIIHSFPHTHTALPTSTTAIKSVHSFPSRYGIINHWIKRNRSDNPHDSLEANSSSLPCIPSHEDIMENRRVGFFPAVVAANDNSAAVTTTVKSQSINDLAKISHICHQSDDKIETCLYNYGEKNNSNDQNNEKYLQQQQHPPSPRSTIIQFNHHHLCDTYTDSNHRPLSPNRPNLLINKEHDCPLLPIHPTHDSSTFTTKRKNHHRSSSYEDEDEKTHHKRTLRKHSLAMEHLENAAYDDALEIFETILKDQIRRYGDYHRRVGSVWQNLCVVYLKKGDGERAVNAGRMAVTAREVWWGTRYHPDVAQSISQLGIAHLERHSYRDALTTFLEALQIRRKLYGDDHPKVAKILNNVGCAFFAIDDMTGAKMAFEETLAIQRSSLKNKNKNDGDDGCVDDINSRRVLLNIACSLCNLGSIQFRKGFFEECVNSLEEALLIQQSVLGDDHETVCHTIDSIEYVDDMWQRYNKQQSRCGGERIDDSGDYDDDESVGAGDAAQQHDQYLFDNPILHCFLNPTLSIMNNNNNNKQQRKNNWYEHAKDQLKRGILIGGITSSSSTAFSNNEQQKQICFQDEKRIMNKNDSSKNKGENIPRKSHDNHSSNSILNSIEQKLSTLPKLETTTTSMPKNHHHHLVKNTTNNNESITSERDEDWNWI